MLAHTSAALGSGEDPEALCAVAEATDGISLPQASQIRVKVFRTAPQWGHLFIVVELIGQWFATLAAKLVVCPDGGFASRTFCYLGQRRAAVPAKISR